MLFGKLVALAAVIASSVAAGKIEIKNAENPAKIANAYAAEFPAGVDGVNAVKSYFQSKGLTATIRTTITNAFINQVSFAIAGDHGVLFPPARLRQLAPAGAAGIKPDVKKWKKDAFGSIRVGGAE
ncbi:hypothetical protein HDU96_004576 [Phlyctochytrium bullatum]|nr:hypothetical protein HDU96_004576 [Phlyctochytrium bullatum]